VPHAATGTLDSQRRGHKAVVPEVRERVVAEVFVERGDVDALGMRPERRNVGWVARRRARWKTPWERSKRLWESRGQTK